VDFRDLARFELAVWIQPYGMAGDAIDKLILCTVNPVMGIDHTSLDSSVVVEFYRSGSAL